MLLLAALVIVGIFTGILAGVFGIGGGILFTPVLFFIFGSAGVGQPVAWTIGTSLFCTFIAATSSTYQQFKENNIYPADGIKVGLFGALGVYGGKLISTSRFYTEELFVTVFALLLVLVAYLFYMRGQSRMKPVSSLQSLNTKKYVIVGVAGGSVASLAGVGGGVVIVPVLNLWYKADIAKAVSISSLAVLLISLSGWLQFALLSEHAEGATAYTLGFVDFGSGFPLVIGAFLGGLAGVKLSVKIPQDKRQIAFSVLALIVALAMISGLF